MKPIRSVLALAALLLTTASGPSLAGSHDVEPRLKLVVPTQTGPATLALTFDACTGAVDRRILDTLVANDIAATVFVTHRWLRRNGEAMAIMLARPDLFQIENHGDHHVPAVTDEPTVFGVKTAGSLAAVKSEVDGGAAAVLAATGHAPHWFRGATARYSRDAMAEIAAEGYGVAGYSLNADQGASLPAASVARRMAAARSGDVIIAHINQPDRASGAGVAAGILALKRAGARFVRLDDLPTLASQ